MPLPTRRRLARALLACVAIALLAAVSGLVGYELGGRRGFQDGFVRSSYGGESVDALMAIRAIELIDAGKPDAARAILDSIPDGAMISYSAFADLDFSRFSNLEERRDIPASYRRVAVYRVENPTSMPPGDARETIQKTAEVLLRDVPEPLRSESCEVAARRITSP